MTEEKRTEAEDLTTKAKMYFYNAIDKSREDLMEFAWQCWCEIYLMFETPENESESRRIQDSKDLAEIMAHFTDDEVYGITGYAKKKYA